MNSASALLASIRSHRRRGPASEWTHAGPVAAILFEDAVATIQRFISEDPLALGGGDTNLWRKSDHCAGIVYPDS